MARRKRAPEANVAAEWGNLHALAVSVYRYSRSAVEDRRKRKDWNSEAVLTEILVVLSPLGRTVPIGKYRARIIFDHPLNSGALAAKIEAIDWSRIDLDGGRMHLGAVSVDGAYIPLSKALGNPEGAAALAVNELENNSSGYLDDLHEPSEEEAQEKAAAWDKHKKAAARKVKKGATAKAEAKADKKGLSGDKRKAFVKRSVAASVGAETRRRAKAYDSALIEAHKEAERRGITDGAKVASFVKHSVAARMGRKGKK